MLHSFVLDKNGTTAIEYALVASLIAVAIVVAVGSLGTNVLVLYNKVMENWP